MNLFSLFPTFFHFTTSTCVPSCNNVPSCNPPTYSNDYIDWYSCASNFDGSAWYGITKGVYDYHTAVELCSCLGAELVSPVNNGMEICARSVILESSYFDQLVLFSGRYDSVTDNRWEWCPAAELEDGLQCQSYLGQYFGAVNYFANMNLPGECMGAVLNSNFNYYWDIRECSSITSSPAKAICRFNCFGYTQPETEIPQICSNSCSSNPCLNGGTCSELAPQSYTCSCAEGYTGENCQSEIIACASENCDPYMPSNCVPEPWTYDLINWNSCTPNNDGDSYYGISIDNYHFESAVELCQCVGGELVSIHNTFIDSCAKDTINYQNVFEELVLYSGRYVEANSRWEWCPFSNLELSTTCEYAFGAFANSVLNFRTPGQCMGGYSINSNDYGWIESGCHELQSNKVKVMCRLSCTDYSTPESNSCNNLITLTNFCKDSNPCQNGGTCVEDFENSSYECVCTVGYSGQNCDQTTGVGTSEVEATFNVYQNPGFINQMVMSNVKNLVLQDFTTNVVENYGISQITMVPSGNTISGHENIINSIKNYGCWCTRALEGKGY